LALAKLFDGGARRDLLKKRSETLAGGRRRRSRRMFNFVCDEGSARAPSMSGMSLNSTRSNIWSPPGHHAGVVAGCDAAERRKGTQSRRVARIDERSGSKSNRAISHASGMRDRNVPNLVHRFSRAAGALVFQIPNLKFQIRAKDQRMSHRHVLRIHGNLQNVGRKMHREGPCSRH